MGGHGSIEQLPGFSAVTGLKDTQFGVRWLR